MAGELTPALIDKSLREIITRAGAIAKDPLAREAREVAACVSLLALVVADQEKRLRAMAPPVQETRPAGSGTVGQ